MEHLLPQQAAHFLKEEPDALFIDCRSEMEYLFVGHPRGALHVAWIDEPDWTVNPHFVSEVRKMLLGGAMRHDGVEAAPVILICRSGKRSIDAGRALLAELFGRFRRSVGDDCQRQAPCSRPRRGLRANRPCSS